MPNLDLQMAVSKAEARTGMNSWHSYAQHRRAAEKEGIGDRSGGELCLCHKLASGTSHDSLSTKGNTKEQASYRKKKKKRTMFGHHKCSISLRDFQDRTAKGNAIPPRDWLILGGGVRRHILAWGGQVILLCLGLRRALRRARFWILNGKWVRKLEFCDIEKAGIQYFNQLMLLFLKVPGQKI